MYTITLTADTTVTTGLTATNRTITFDLNGFNLSISNNNGHGLALTNSKIDYTGTGSFTVSSTHEDDDVFGLHISGGSVALTGVTIDTGQVQGYGDAIFAVNGAVSAASGYAINAGDANSSATVIVTGNVTSSGSGNNAITALENSRVSIGAVGSPGHVSADGAAIIAEVTAEVNVVGNVSSTADNAIWAADSAKVEVTGNVSTANMGNNSAVIAADEANIKITGNVSATACTDCAGVSARDESTVEVIGNITMSGVEETLGAIASGEGKVKVTGNISATGATANIAGIIYGGAGIGIDGAGATLPNHPKVIVTGNVSATHGAGVEIWNEQGDVTINGTITAPTYIIFYDNFIQPTTFTAAGFTSTSGGYRVYADGSSIARVIIPSTHHTTTQNIPVMTPVGLALLALALGGLVFQQRRRRLG